MPKKGRKIGMTCQLNLMVTPKILPSSTLDLSDQFKRLCNRLIKKQGYSRAQLADALTYLSGRKVSERTINDFLEEKKIHQLPAVLLPALCAMLGSIEPFEILLNPIDYSVIGPKDQKILALRKMEMQREILDAEIADLKRNLKSEGLDK